MFYQEELFRADVSAHIDRLTLLAKPQYGDLGRLEDELCKSALVEKVTEAKFPYRRAFKCIDGIYISTKDTLADQIPPFRLDFNPWKKSDDVVRELRRILSIVERPRVTRLDVAIDYIGVDLSMVEWMEDRSRKRQELRSSSRRLETLYLGSLKSNNLLRIYDKGLESEKDFPWWRVEAQMRIEKGCQVWAKNPFSGLHGSARAAPPGGRMQEIAMIELLRSHPEYLSDLEPHLRAKYKKRLLEGVDECPVEPSPADVFEKEKASLQGQVAEWMRCCGSGNTRV